MRSGHRRSAEELVGRIGRLLVRARRKDGDTGGRDIRLQQVTAIGQYGAARGEAGHLGSRRRVARRVARGEGRRCSRGCRVGNDGIPVAGVQVDGGHRVEVSVDGCRCHVDQDHADSAGPQDLGRFGDPVVDTAVTDHDAVRRNGGERTRTAQVRVGDPRGRECRRVDEGARQRNSVLRHVDGDGCPRERLAVTQGYCRLIRGNRGCRDGRDPGARIIEGGCAGAVVPSGGRHEHSRGRSPEERLIRRGEGRLGRSAADRVVDHVDAVGDGLVDSGEKVGGRAAVIRPHRGIRTGPADLVDGDLRGRSHAGDRPEVDAADIGGRGHIARCRACSVGAVPIPVPR